LISLHIVYLILYIKWWDYFTSTSCGWQ